MKKTIAIITLLLTVSMSAFAQIFFFNNIAYNVLSDEDMTVEVHSGISFNGSELIIPDKVTGWEREYTVTGIGQSAFLNSASIISVSIPATVKTIGNRAFQNCGNLTSLTFEGESQLKQIGDYAFMESGFTTISIPASVTSIGAFAFDENKALQKVYMHRDDPSGYSFNAFNECPDLVIYAPAASYEAYNTQFNNRNKVEVELTEWKTYATSKIEEGLNALNTLSDEDRNDVNNYLSDITDPSTFDDAYNAFKTAMSIINAQINFEKNLKTALGSMATKQNGPAVEIIGADGTTIRLYNIEKVRYIKVNE